MTCPWCGRELARSATARSIGVDAIINRWISQNVEFSSSPDGERLMRLKDDAGIDAGIDNQTPLGLA